MSPALASRFLTTGPPRSQHTGYSGRRNFFFNSIDILREERLYNHFFSKDKHSGNEKKTLRNVKLGNRILKLNEVGSSSKS